MCSQEFSSFPARPAGQAAQHGGGTGTSSQGSAGVGSGGWKPSSTAAFWHGVGKNYVTKAFVLCFRRKLPPAQLYTTARMKFGEREWQPRRRRQKRHLSCRGSNAGIPSVRQGAQGPSPWHPPCLSSRATQFCLCNWDSLSARCWKSQCHQTWGSTPG